MPNIRIKDIPTTASATSSTDFIAIDGATNGTRKLSADSPVFSGNLTAPDLILGTSGPSVRSSLGAKASRQGLIYDGTTAVTATSGSLGTQFTIAFDVTLSSVAIQQPLLFFSGSGFIGVRITSGALFWSSAGADFTSNIPANKTTHVVVVGNGTTATPYINGVAGATIAYTASVGAITQIGFVGNPSSTVGPVRLYNRALTAAEVVSLYEAGTPSGADFNNANNTGFVTGDNSTFASDTGFWTKGASVAITGGEAVWTGAAGLSRPSLSFSVGKRYLLTINVTQASTNGWSVFNGSSYVATGITGTGVQTYVLTPVAATGFYLTNGDGANGKITDLTLTPLGLLLAPDAQQSGGGTVWYDTSGNSANITLPASGVQWSVPTSGKIGNALAITNTTASTSTTTGSLVLSGGLGVAGALFTGGAASFSTTTDRGGLTLNFPVAATGSNGPSATFKTWTNSTILVDAGRIASIITDGSASYASKLEFSVANAGSLTTALTIENNSNATFAGGIKTVAPTSGTAQFWELGEAATVTPTLPNRTLRVEIAGTVYFIHAKTTND